MQILIQKYHYKNCQSKWKSNTGNLTLFDMSKERLNTKVKVTFKETVADDKNTLRETCIILVLYKVIYKRVQYEFLRAYF